MHWLLTASYKIKMSQIETLIKERDERNRWYPIGVEEFRGALELDATVPHVRELRQNLSYSLQYIQFLELQLEELNLSSVMCTMIYKSYVITGMAILEGIFSNIIKSKGWWKQSFYESLGETTANEKKFGTEKYVIKTEILRKVGAHDVQMTMDEMIKKLVHHHDALNINHLDYPVLRNLKQLRNRVHLQMIEGPNDHDYNAFDLSSKNDMQTILYHVLTSPNITNHPHVFDFLKPDEATTV